MHKYKDPIELYFNLVSINMNSQMLKKEFIEAEKGI